MKQYWMFAVDRQAPNGELLGKIECSDDMREKIEKRLMNVCLSDYYTPDYYTNENIDTDESHSESPDSI